MFTMNNHRCLIHRLSLFLLIKKNNMSYGATVGASTACSNLIKLKTYFLPLSWINPMYTATFKVVYWLFKKC